MRFLLDSTRPDPEAEEEALAYLLRQRGKALRSDELRDMIFEAFVREAVESFCAGERAEAVDKLTEAQHLYWPAGSSDRIDPLERWIESCLNVATYEDEFLVWTGWDVRRKPFDARAITAPLRQRVNYDEAMRSIFREESAETLRNGTVTVPDENGNEIDVVLSLDRLIEAEIQAVWDEAIRRGLDVTSSSPDTPRRILGPWTETHENRDTDSEGE